MTFDDILRAVRAREMTPQEAEEALRRLSSARSPGETTPMQATRRVEQASLLALQGALIEDLARVLYVEAADVGLDRKFIEMGLDSVLGVEWMRAVNARFGLSLPATKLYDYPTVRDFAVLIAHSLGTSVEAQSEGSDDVTAPTPNVDQMPAAPPISPPSNAHKPSGIALRPLSEISPINVSAVSRAPVVLRATTSTPLPKVVASMATATESQPTAAVSQPGSERGEPIAIVGMAGRYPGAENLAQYWRNLAQGKNSVREIPAERWNVQRYFSPVPQAGKIYCKWLGVVDDAQCFDPLFFNISPAEAIGMDPQQRLFLQESYRAFEDAGYSPSTLSNRKCGVYLGIMASEYGWLLQRRTGGLADATGNSSAIAAARIAYYLNLKGPAIAIDTACSSSLVATHLACQALRNGEIDMALTGGVTLYLTPESYVAMCAAGMLSPDGQCKTFDNGANGFVPADGVGAIVLKRLRDAEADGDHVYGVIVGSGINQDGKTNGITAPSMNSQMELEQQVYRDAGVHPQSITYVEMHGTGTKLGDPIELEALATVYRERATEKNYCALGSVKSNLGHTSAAAGVASIHKVLLQLRHGQLAPTLHFEHPNEHFDFGDSPFYVNTTLQDWYPRQGEPRRAAVSSFGYSGTNAHLIIEEYRRHARPRVPALDSGTTGSVVVVLSAKSEEQLRERAAQLAAHLETTTDVDLRDVAYTLQIGREPMDYRLAFIADTRQTVCLLLSAFLTKSEARGLYLGQAKRLRTSTALFDGDEDVRTLLQTWQRKRKLSKLAEAWVDGGDIDWRGLYDGEQRRRVPLPTYPFARERYWITATPSDSVPTVSTRYLHPLVHENTSDFSTQRYSSTFTGEEPLLYDHRVQGTPVFPAAGYAEMMRAAVALAFGSDASTASLGLHRLTFIEPLIVATPVRVHVTLLPDQSGDIRCRIYSETDGAVRVHAEGTASARLEVDASKIDLASLRSTDEQSISSVEHWYERFRQFGIEYGATYRGVTGIHLTEREGRRVAVADIKLPATECSVAPLYGLHPSLLDAALQATVALIDEEPDVGAGQPKLRLPFAIDAIDIFTHCPEAAIAVVRQPDAGTTNIRKFDIDIGDGEGNVYARVRGFATRAVSKLIAAQDADTLLFVPAYETSSRTAVEVGIPPVFAEHTVILCSPSPGHTDYSLYKEYASVGETAPDIRWIRLEAEESGIHERFARYAAAILVQLKESMARKQRGHVLIQIVTACDGEEAMLAGLSGLARTARLENPSLQVQWVGVESRVSPDRLIERLIAERAQCEDAAVRYRNGIRERQILSEVVNQPVGGAPFKVDGVYLITGGMGELALLFARAIIWRAGSVTLILVGRSSLSETQRRALREMAVEGIHVSYETVDVTDRLAVERLVADIVTRFGKLDGILHAAGTLHDSFILKKSEKELRAVLAPKVDGAIHLDAATRHLNLDMFVLFSSAASILGNTGQADYASANAFLDAFAHYRNDCVKRGERHGHTLSINWPYWAEGGMRVEESALSTLRQRTGASPLPGAEGIAAFERALALGEPQVLVMYGDALRLRATLAPSPVSERSRDTHDGRPVQARNVAGQDLRDRTIRYLKRQLSGVLKMTPDRIDAAAPLEKYGIDSVMAMQLTQELERTFGVLSKTLFFEYQTLAALAEYFLQMHGATLASLLDRDADPTKPHPLIPVQPLIASGATPKRHRFGVAAGSSTAADAASFDIAIVGLSGRYPGARNVAEFWENLKRGIDCIREIPRERWDHSMYFDPEKGRPGKTYTKWGGFIEDVDKFDPRFFNLSPREAEMMDPQERLFLQCAWETLEDAGYTRESVGRYRGEGLETSVGVFVGVMYQEYQLYGAQAQALGDPVALPGSVASIANRVSYFLNLHGPSFAVDSMCSSSLTAIHLARQSLLHGECEMAIAGGVNVSVHPNKYLALAQGQFASSKGRCESFGQGGDGYVPGEGVGAVLLKSLARAIEDGDHIYGVIKGSAINHGGKTNGYTVPNPLAQGSVIRQALASSGVSARALSYIEAHGTGTSLGDPIEITGLTRALGEHTRDKQYCAIGSVKSNIGHLESAAGIAGLTKVLLQMQHQILVPSLHADTLNPHIDFADSPFFVQRSTALWQRPRILNDGSEREYPRIAGISSFGAGGANAHLIVEEYRPSDATYSMAGVEKLPVLIVLSAKNEERLREQAERLRAFIVSDDDRTPIADIAYTLQVGREAMESRLAFIAVSSADVSDKLQRFLRGESNGAFYRGDVRRQSGVVAMFGTDDVLQEAVFKWVEQSKYDKLLELWAGGVDVDWRRLYPNSIRPKRVSLPTYPFARERYWFEASPLAPQRARMLHPLVHENVSTLDEQRFRSVFTGEETFLKDHVVRGQRLLPGVCYLEMMRTAMEQSFEMPTNVPTAIRLSDIVWLRPLAVDRERAVRIALHPEGGDGVGCEISSVAAGSGGEEPLTHAQGRVRRYAGAAETIDWKRFDAQATDRALSRDDCYRAFTSMGIVYGPSHQVIERIDVKRDAEGETIALAVLQAADNAAAEACLLPPDLLDGALQAAIGLADDATRAPLLPFAVDEVVIFAPLPRRCRAVVRRHDGGNDDRSVRRLDIVLGDEQGRVCIRITGLTARALTSATEISADVSPSVSRALIGTLAMVPVWDTVAVESAVSSRIEATVVVIGGNDVIESRLAARFTRVRHLDIDKNTTIENIAEALASIGVADEIFWFAQNPPLVSSVDDVLVAGRGESVQLGFRLVKALLAVGYGTKNIGLHVVTSGTNALRDEEIHPFHAGLTGLFGSVANEYPMWRIRLADVADMQAAPFESLPTLPSNPSGEIWLHRHGQWHRQRLAMTTLNRSTDTRFRHGGTYVIVGGAGGLGETFSEYLIGKYHAQLVWIGRREKDADIQAKLDRLGTLGPTPYYIGTDAAERHALERALADIKQRFGAVHGVIHSAITLADKSLANMDEATLNASLRAKIDVSVRLVQVFGGEPLDFLLFFSSMQSFTKAAGQANYAAGCTFQDAFIRRFATTAAYPVKTINWGYWGSVGVVASKAYRERMANLGVGSIEPPEGTDIVERLLGSSLKQLAYLKVTNTDALHRGLHPTDRLHVLPNVSPAILEVIRNDCRFATDPVCEAVLDRAKVLEHWMAKLLHVQLQRLGLSERTRENVDGWAATIGLQPLYKRWLDESLRVLAVRGCFAGSSSEPPGDALWNEWQQAKQVFEDDPNLAAQCRLVDITLRALPDILTGRRSAPHVVFPNSSMELVEAIYKNNAIADYFNGALADVIVAYVGERVRRDPTVRLRLIEIGAGTGGTSAMLFKKLAPYVEHIEEYCYTDISKSFLVHAEKVYAAQAPYLVCRLLDVEARLEDQGIALGQYDIAIAANVLHATTNIRRTLRNAKAVLKGNGLLSMNEIVGESLFAHLTFGLLEGWWRYEDESLRISGSPALAPERWCEVLHEEGFRNVLLPCEAARSFGQQIIVAESDGVVRQAAALVAEKLVSSEKRSPVASKRTSVVKGDALVERLQTVLVDGVSDLLKFSRDDVELDAEFSEFGFDSISLTGFSNRLNEALGLEINPTIFFEHPTIRQLAAHLVQTHGERLVAALALPESAASSEASNVDTPVETTTAAVPKRQRFLSRVEKTRGEPSRDREPIAIVGISGAFPRATDVHAFWNNLEAGIDCIGEIPESRWDWRAIYGDPQKEPNKSHIKWGGFLEGVEHFDPLFFGISPREAEVMDPQQRLMMMHVWKAIEDAGYSPESLSGSRTALLIGTGATGYADVIARANLPIEGYSATGTAPSLGPNRMSYLLNLHGPSEPIETACSSALVAVHRAVALLQSGECEMAIAGGVNTLVSPGPQISFSKAGMLAEDGRCKTFSKDANGYVRGEGVGILFLKKLSAAERDGDHIYALIRGSSENHGGRANSLTAPNPKAQADLIKDAYTRAGIDPRTVTFIEAHGTGTPLGDPIEINALKSAFKDLYAATGDSTTTDAHCAIGAVKTHIGHLELAAGAAGLIKILLQLKHKTLVKNLHCDEVNPYIDLTGSPFYFLRENRPWEALRAADGTVLPRRAGVSSFGFGGVNAHVVIEEYIPAEPFESSRTPQVPAIIPLSAKNDERLVERVRQLHDAIVAGRYMEEDLPRIAYTLQIGRESMEARLALVVASLGELTSKLQGLLDGSDIAGVYRGQVKRGKPPLALFAADDALQETVAKWVERGEYEKLAELWVNGLPFDWLALYGASKPRRISLPTYPFAKDRCWATPDERPSAVVADAGPRSTVGTAAALFYDRLLDDLLSDVVSVDTAIAQTRKLISTEQTP